MYYFFIIYKDRNRTYSNYKNNHKVLCLHRNFSRDLDEEFWKLSPHENVARMRLKLEPQLYPNKHENAANLRDNATSAYDTK